MRKQTVLFVFFTIIQAVWLFAGCTATAQPAAPTVPASPSALPSATAAPTDAVLPTAAAPVVEPTPTAPAAEAIPPTGDSSPTPTEPAADAPAAEDCTNTAGFFGDVTIPDGTAFKQDEAFIKTWRFRNEGTCTWNSNYAFVFHSGEIMSGPLSSPLPTVQPGELVDISLNLKSPTSGGEFTGYWQFQDPQGKRFGVNSNGVDLIWVKIGVTIFNAQGEVVAVGAPLPVAPTPASPAQSPTTTAATPNLGGKCSPERNSDYEQQILTKINDARATAGLSPLKLQESLNNSAFAHSKDMACKDFVDHIGSDGSTWNTRIKAQNYNFKYATENIYVGNPAFGGTPDGAFNWWMNSEIHRNNILSTKVTEIGIGYAYLATSSFGGYYTLNFARP